MSWEIELVEELNNAKNGEKTVIIKKYESLTGKSSRQLYRIAEKFGYKKPERKVRKDKGTTSLTDHQIDYVSALLSKSARLNHGVIMSVETALEIAVDNNVIEENFISAARVQQILNDRKQSKKYLDAPDSHVEMKSLYPNHVHEPDVSVCIQWFLDEKKGMGEYDERAHYKNKPQNLKKIKKHLLRYVLIDHATGSFFVKYYYDGGETQNNMYDFLLSAWELKNDKYPFRGKPEFILMDAGAANTSKAMLEFLRRLEIEIPKSLPHNPRRQGAVETTHKIVERNFESRLRFHPAKDLEELNKWALDWAAYHNAQKIHSRHGMTRTEAWLKISNEKLIEIPDRKFCQHLFAKPEEQRTVNGSYKIGFNGKKYSVAHIPNIAIKDKVMVVLKPYIYPQISVRFDSFEYLCDPIETDEFGFLETAATIGKEHKKNKNTPAQYAKERIEEIAHGSGDQRTKIPFEGIKVFGHQAEKLPDVTFIPKRGTTFYIDKETVMEQRIPRIKALQKIKAELGSVPDGLGQQMKDAFGESISVDELNRLIEGIGNGGSDGKAFAEANEA